MSATVPVSADEFIVRQLHDRLSAVEKVFDADALCIAGPMASPLDDLIRAAAEHLRKQYQPPRDRLVLLITTEGGYIETVQRIVETLRYHYTYIGCIIPNYAYSAGTVLAMSGDDIFMDYYSRLGPIDPQVDTTTGRLVPALGYLRQWEKLIEKGKDGTLTPVEFQLMIVAFDQAELYKYDQAQKLSVMLLEQWLTQYKFKDWDRTETKKRRVTDRMRKKRAVEIAEALNETEVWHSHGHGISMAVLQDQLKLKIDDLGGQPTRHDAVKEYSGLFVDYMQKIGFEGIIHTVGRFRPWL